MQPERIFSRKTATRVLAMTELELVAGGSGGSGGTPSYTYTVAQLADGTYIWYIGDTAD